MLKTGIFLGIPEKAISSQHLPSSLAVCSNVFCSVYIKALPTSGIFNLILLTISQHSQPLILAASHPRSFSSSQLLILAASHPLILAASHPLIVLSSSTPNQDGRFHHPLEGPRGQPYQPQSSFCTLFQPHQFIWKSLLLLLVWFPDRFLVMVRLSATGMFSCQHPIDIIADKSISCRSPSQKT